MNRTQRSIMAGAAGACALTLVHQAARAATPNAPRMDVLGRRALRLVHSRTGADVPSETTLQREALAGDLLANSAYYALVGGGDRGTAWRRGLALGLAAGLGALFLPRRMGLGDPPHADRLDTQLMTVAWYVVGGLAAAAAYAATEADEPVPHEPATD